jgi:hypothetical protein
MSLTRSVPGWISTTPDAADQDAVAEKATIHSPMSCRTVAPVTRLFLALFTAL